MRIQIERLLPDKTEFIEDTGLKIELNSKLSNLDKFMDRLMQQTCLALRKESLPDTTIVRIYQTDKPKSGMSLKGKFLTSVPEIVVGYCGDIDDFTQTFIHEIIHSTRWDEDMVEKKTMEIWTGDGTMTQEQDVERVKTILREVFTDGVTFGKSSRQIGNYSISQKYQEIVTALQPMGEGNPKDECYCGDFRENHNNGTGGCKICSWNRLDQTVPPCPKFRLANKPTPSPELLLTDEDVLIDICGECRISDNPVFTEIETNIYCKACRFGIQQGMKAQLAKVSAGWVKK